MKLPRSRGALATNANGYNGYTYATERRGENWRPWGGRQRKQHVYDATRHSSREERWRIHLSADRLTIRKYVTRYLRLLHPRPKKNNRNFTAQRAVGVRVGGGVFHVLGFPPLSLSSLSPNALPSHFTPLLGGSGAFSHTHE